MYLICAHVIIKLQYVYKKTMPRTKTKVTFEDRPYICTRVHDTTFVFDKTGQMVVPMPNGQRVVDGKALPPDAQLQCFNEKSQSMCSRLDAATCSTMGAFCELYNKGTKKVKCRRKQQLHRLLDCYARIQQLTKLPVDASEEITALRTEIVNLNQQILQQTKLYTDSLRTQETQKQLLWDMQSKYTKQQAEMAYLQSKKDTDASVLQEMYQVKLNLTQVQADLKASQEKETEYAKQLLYNLDLLRRVNAYIETLIKERNSYADTIINAEKIFSSMDNEKAALTSKNNALIGQIDMYQQKLIETNDKYVQAMQDFIDYRNNAVAVQAKLEQIEADNREYMVAIENLNAAVLKLYDTSRQQQSSLAEWQEYSDELQTMVTAQQNEIAEKNNAVDLILQELDLVENIRTQNQQTSAEEINDLKRQIRELQIQLEENNSTVQLENMRLQDLGRSRQLEAERNALRLEIEQLKKEMRDISRESEVVLAEQDATIRRLRQKLNRMGAN